MIENLQGISAEVKPNVTNISTSKKRRHTCLEPEEAFKSQMQTEYKIPLDAIYDSFLRKEESWQREFLSLTRPHIDNKETVPRSVNEVGSFFFSLSIYWVMQIQTKMEACDNTAENQRIFLQIFNAASEYHQDNKLPLIDYIIKLIEENFTKAEILTIINKNPHLKEKRTNIYDITKNDYKYFLDNPDFFTCLVPKYSTGKKLKTREAENSKSCSVFSRSKGKSLERTLTKLSPIAPVAVFQCNIEFPKDEVVNNLNESLNHIDVGTDNTTENHYYSHSLKKGEALLEEIINSNVKPIPEEKNDDENYFTQANNNNISNFNKLSIANEISVLLIAKEGKVDLNKLKMEIINANELKITNSNLTIAETKKPLNKLERSNSFNIIPSEKEIKRISFVDNYTKDAVIIKDNKNVITENTKKKSKSVGRKKRK